MSLTDNITDTIKDALPKIKEALPKIKDALPKLRVLADSGHVPNVGSAEREVSLAAGALLGLVLLRRGGWMLTGAALAAVAGGLLYRGATGYCMVNNAIGRNSMSDDLPQQPQAPKVDIVQP